MIKAPAKIMILTTGSAGIALTERFGDFADMIQDWLQPALPDVVFEAINVHEDAPLPLFSDYQGYIVTGSPSGVYEQQPWMLRLQAFMHTLAQAHIPQFGICFGHQIMAQAFGGVVAKSDKGWGIGAQAYTFDLDGVNTEASVYLFHQDQVETLPEQARVVGGSDFCPHGALAYRFPARSVQFHPEFHQSFMHALWAAKASVLPETVRKEGVLDSIEQQTVNNRVFAQWVAEFFKNNMKW